MTITILNSMPTRLANFFRNPAQTAKRHPKKTFLCSVLLLAWLFCLKTPLFEKPISHILLDRDGELLGARIADDGQWRFPQLTEVPEKYTTCLLQYEDKRFYYHPGVDPFSLLRAIKSNISHTKVVSGGSTITMQVIRMSRDNPPRTIPEKLLEVFQATRIELTHRKKTILALYASNAPFGGNVVGLEAASWRYFGKRPSMLTWAEAATLAVLPNSPGLIHPGRNRQALTNKRNALLRALVQSGKITQETCDLALIEPIPDAPIPLPQEAPHLLDRLIAANSTSKGNKLSPQSGRYYSTIQRTAQRNVTASLERWASVYKGNGVHNMAAVVIDVPTGEVLVYIGNIANAGSEHGQSVDILSAPRSTGSILKPYLYAFGLQDGTILPNSLLHDVPTQMQGYKPENYMYSYDGAIPARRALVRSLNVPFVLLLRDYGVERFHFGLKQLGLTTLGFPPNHYGLSLALGGAEANLLDITNAYASMSRTLINYAKNDDKYNLHDFHPPLLTCTSPTSSKKIVAGLGLSTSAEPSTSTLVRDAPILSAGAIYHTFQAMQEVERPSSSGEWQLFQAGQPIAWKTGTSFGFRDAWAAGVTQRYAVGVWVGNADGEGRPGLIGVQTAAPVLFEIFGQLPTAQWFEAPYNDMVQAPLCRHSGYRAGKDCPDQDSTWVPKTSLRGSACTYCKILHLSPDGKHQVAENCQIPSEMLHKPWFVLPADLEYYYKSKNPSYQIPPALRADCVSALDHDPVSPIQMLYPRKASKITIPTELDGSPGKVVMQAAHRRPDATMHWHLDGQYLGKTEVFHQMAVNPPDGKHTLVLVDQDGLRQEQSFESQRAGQRGGNR